ncbi:MAG: DUF2344 domain-containing protein, partial [Firmicutes bacterium]|nr:DUF2344 domain-containing protein [Bacillota bacterium]
MFHYSLCFSKEGDISFISHLDLLRTFVRALRRAEVPVVYSKGFNPAPRLTFAVPLAVGMEGKNEYLDLYLDKPWEENKLEESLSKQLPEGLRIKKVSRVKVDRPPTSSEVAAALYVVDLPVDSVIVPELRQAVKRILQEETIIKLRRGRGGKNVKKVDLRPFIYDLKVKDVKGKGLLLMLLATGSRGGARPQEVMELLPLGGDIKTYRQDLFQWE